MVKRITNATTCSRQVTKNNKNKHYLNCNFISSFLFYPHSISIQKRTLQNQIFINFSKALLMFIFEIFISRFIFKNYNYISVVRYLNVAHQLIPFYNKPPPPPHPHQHSAMCSICTWESELAEVSEMRQILQTEILQKSTGYSLTSPSSSL